MGACHQCKCFYCENLCTKKCPIGRVCSTCYKGTNSQSFKITHGDKQVPYDPTYTVTTAPQRPKRNRKPLIRKDKRTSNKKK